MVMFSFAQWLQLSGQHPIALSSKRFRLNLLLDEAVGCLSRVVTVTCEHNMQVRSYVYVECHVASSSSAKLVCWSLDVGVAKLWRYLAVSEGSNWVVLDSSGSRREQQRLISLLWSSRCHPRQRRVGAMLLAAVCRENLLCGLRPYTFVTAKLYSFI